MKILIINSVCGVGSTGRICCDIARKYMSEGHIVKVAYGRKSSAPDDIDTIEFGSSPEFYTHILMTRLSDTHGFHSRLATKRFLAQAETFDPDMVWLHNIHGYYINVEMLFDWIKSRPSMKVKWTLHDCWAFTGHCTQFQVEKCEKWKTGCESCPAKREYPTSFLLDNSRKNYIKKKAAFTGVKSLELITPSRWLAELTRDSFLRKYPVSVQYNTVNTDIFYHRDSNFKAKHNIEGKYMILGVSNGWIMRKGLEDFIEAANHLSEKFVIVLVGLDRKQIESLPSNCVGLGRTNSAEELAEIYSAADCFFNPTYEDNLPTVNLEARACGAYIYSYDTGGCAETFGEGEGEILPVGGWRLFVERVERDAAKNAAT